MKPKCIAEQWYAENLHLNVEAENAFDNSFQKAVDLGKKITEERKNQYLGLAKPLYMWAFVSKKNKHSNNSKEEVVLTGYDVDRKGSYQSVSYYAIIPMGKNEFGLFTDFLFIANGFENPDVFILKSSFSSSKLAGHLDYMIEFYGNYGLHFNGFCDFIEKAEEENEK
ncbi:MAG: hypothetical protein ACOCUI_00745 [bacterium]